MFVISMIYDDPGVKLSAVSNSPDDLEQEHLGADDEAPAGLQDADEEAGAGGQRQPYQPQPHQSYQSTTATNINHINHHRHIIHTNISA